MKKMEKIHYKIKFKKKKAKNLKKFSIAETITPYLSINRPFENMIDKIIHGDNLTILKSMPKNSINLIITSPED